MDLVKVDLSTAEEIDAYYDKVVRDNLRKKELLVHRRNFRRDSIRLIKLVGITVVITILVVIFVKLSTDITTHTRNVSVLEREVGSLRLANDDADKRIRDRLDVRDIERRASELGMGYPKADAIIYYQVEDSDYMIVCERKE